MRVNKIVPVNTPLVTRSDIKSVKKVLKSNEISGESCAVSKFENEFAHFCNMEYGIGVSSGTLAIDILIDSIGLGPGDEVIIQSFTIISCLSQILRAGAKPVFIDSDKSTWNIKASDIEQFITSRTKAILVAHMYGLPADIEQIKIVAEKYGLFFIEDASQAHGLKYKDKICGSFGDASTFSFYANKNLTTGEGGMVMTNRRILAESLKGLRSLNFSKERRFKSFDLGWGGRMTAMQAALGSSQLNRIDRILRRKIEIGAKYYQAVKEMQSFEIAPPKTTFAVNSYWVFGVVLKEDSDLSPIQLQDKLLDLGIQTRPFFYPLHRQPVLSKFDLSFKQFELPVAERLGNRGFYLPGGPGIKDSQINKVIDVLSKLVQ
jgi:perosamine synthetase